MFTLGIHEFGSEPNPAPRKMNSNLVTMDLSKRFVRKVGVTIAGVGAARGNTLTPRIDVVVCSGETTTCSPTLAGSTRKFYLTPNQSVRATLGASYFS